MDGQLHALLPDRPPPDARDFAADHQHRSVHAVAAGDDLRGMLRLEHRAPVLVAEQIFVVPRQQRDPGHLRAIPALFAARPVSRTADRFGKKHPVRRRDRFFRLRDRQPRPPAEIVQSRRTVTREIPDRKLPQRFFPGQVARVRRPVLERHERLLFAFQRPQADQPTTPTGCGNRAAASCGSPPARAAPSARRGSSASAPSARPRSAARIARSAGRQSRAAVVCACCGRARGERTAGPSSARLPRAPHAACRAMPR